MNMVAAAAVVSLSIARAGSQPSQKGPAEYFTGSVRIDPLFQAKDTTQASGAYVTFEPGARSAWHTHPRGQTLVVTAGVGRVQIEGGPVEEIRPGDVVSIPRGKRHWHGASPTTAMTHLAIQEHLNGKVVERREKAHDEQCQGVKQEQRGPDPSPEHPCGAARASSTSVPYGSMVRSGPAHTAT